MLNKHHLDHLVVPLGYKTMKDALVSLYVNEHKTLEQCSEILDLTVHCIRRLIKAYEISTPHDTLKKLKIPPKELRGNTIGQLSTKYGTSKSAIWRLKKLDKASKPPRAARGARS